MHLCMCYTWFIDPFIPLFFPHIIWQAVIIATNSPQPYAKKTNQRPSAIRMQEHAATVTKKYADHASGHAVCAPIYCAEMIWQTAGLHGVQFVPLLSYVRTAVRNVITANGSAIHAVTNIHSDVKQHTSRQTIFSCFFAVTANFIHAHYMEKNWSSKSWSAISACMINAMV